MTDTRIDDSLSGRDLDAAIGRALGIKPVGQWQARIEGNQRPLVIGDTEEYVRGYLALHCIVVGDGALSFEKHESWPRYSTDWNAMRFIVEEMQRRGWSYCLSSPDDNSRHDAWFEIWTESGALISRKESSADSLPTAVCRAALLALETEKQ